MNCIRKAVTQDASRFVTVKIANDTDKDILCGADFCLEMQDEETGEWRELDEVIGNAAFDAIAYMIQKDSPYEEAFEAGVVPVLNVLTMSLLMTVVLEYSGSIIAPTIMHFLWNGIGALVLGGVSLADDYPNLLNTTFTGNEILSGGVKQGTK